MNIETLLMLECDMRDLSLRSQAIDTEFAKQVRKVADFWINECSRQRTLVTKKTAEFTTDSHRADQKPLDMIGLGKGSKTGKSDSRK